MESSKKDLAVQTPHHGSTTHWELIQRQCKAFIESGFLPNHIKTLAQAITIAWKGHELGIPPLQAFSSIGVINGKPVLSSELMVALIYQRVKGASVTFKTPVEKQSKECIVEMQRPQGRPMEFRFTIDDAKAAGLLRAGSPWEKYPAAMLRARAISAGARAVFPDATMGCYTPEELGGEVTIDGEFIVEQPKTGALLEAGRAREEKKETLHEPERSHSKVKSAGSGISHGSDFDDDPGFPG